MLQVECGWFESREYLARSQGSLQEGRFQQDQSYLSPKESDFFTNQNSLHVDKKKMP